MFAFSRSRLLLHLVLLASLLASAPSAFAQPRPQVRAQRQNLQQPQVRVAAPAGSEDGAAAGHGPEFAVAEQHLHDR